MVDRLFVYGTLKRGHPARAAWAHLFAGAPEAATAAGRLYALPEGYPMLVTGGEGAVHGEVVALRQPASALADLDVYEGANEGLYERCVVAVEGEAGVVPAWVYRCPAARRAWLEARGVPVPDGVWRAAP